MVIIPYSVQQLYNRNIIVSATICPTVPPECSKVNYRYLSVTVARSICSRRQDPWRELRLQMICPSVYAFMQGVVRAIATTLTRLLCYGALPNFTANIALIKVAFLEFASQGGPINIYTGKDSYSQRLYACGFLGMFLLYSLMAAITYHSWHIHTQCSMACMYI